MCLGERGRGGETDDAGVSNQLTALRESLASLGQGPDEWRVLLDVLVSVHRLEPSTLQAHLQLQRRTGLWPQVEALRLNLRQLAAEEQAMPAAERRGRLRRVGGELLESLAS